MTKVITYNNIQLSFQADTSGIKASKAELGALTREVNSQRTPLERFIRKLEVINQASAKMAPKDVQERIKAVANTFLEAEKKAGRYRDALSALEAFTPQLAQEAQNLRRHYDDLIKTEKELLEINQRLAGEEQLKKRQGEDRRLQIERQVLDFKRQQRQEEKRQASEAAQEQQELERLRQSALQRERNDYVEQFLERERLERQLQQEIERLQQSARRREREDYVREFEERERTERDFEQQMENLRRSARQRERNEYVQEALDRERAERDLQNEIERLKRSARARERAEYVADFERRRAESNRLFQSMNLGMHPVMQAHMRAIEAEQRQNALVQRRMNMYRQMPGFNNNQNPLLAGAAQFGQGAAMGGLPGGMLIGMNPLAIAGVAAVGGIVASVRAYSDMRDKLVLLESQFGNVAKAQSTFLEIRQLAAKSPLETRDLMSAAVTLKQYGVANEEVMTTLQKLAAVSGGSAERLAGLAKAYSQTSSAGKLMGQEVLQFVNSGFNPLNEMVKRTGHSMLQLRKMMENGQITAQDMKDAFTSATQEGGQFAGQMEKQAQELSAKYNAMIDSLRQVGEAIGSLLSGSTRSAMEGLTQFFTHAAHQFNILAKRVEYYYHILFNRDELDFAQNAEKISNEIKNLELQYYGFMKGEQSAAAIEKQQKLFAGFEQRRLEAIKKEQEAREKARAQIEDQISEMRGMQKFEDDYNSILMDRSQLLEKENQKKKEDFRLESEKLALLKAQAEQAGLPEGKRASFQQLLDKYMKESQADQSKFADMLDKTPLAKMAREIIDRNEEAARQANPQIAIMQKAKEIADMINFGMLTQQAGSQELARVMMENTQATQQQSQELPRTIQAGTVEAYQAMFGKDNTAKLQLSEQKKQNDKLSEANGILKQIAAKPGMKKV